MSTFKQRLKSILNQIDSTNPFPSTSCGGLQIVDDFSDLQCYFHSNTKSGDIAVSYDYDIIDLTHPHRDKWCSEWYDKIWWPPRWEHFMNFHGWHQVDEIDGSGNSMYYGAILYRRKPTAVSKLVG